jgi:hypothetical protein
MDKVWFIEINGVRQGPFSIVDLKRDARVTPDTYVWKEGFDTWKRIKDVPELKLLFAEEEPPQENEESCKTPKGGAAEELIVLEMQEPPYLFWILAALIILLYFVIQLYWIK